VCACATLAASSLVPTFSATIGLPAARRRVVDQVVHDLRDADLRLVAGRREEADAHALLLRELEQLGGRGAALADEADAAAGQRRHRGDRGAGGDVRKTEAVGAEHADAEGPRPQGELALQPRALRAGLRIARAEHDGGGNARAAHVLQRLGDAIEGNADIGRVHRFSDRAATGVARPAEHRRAAAVHREQLAVKAIAGNAAAHHERPGRALGCADDHDGPRVEQR
jgi:hypothetical protein